MKKIVNDDVTVIEEITEQKNIDAKPGQMAGWERWVLTILEIAFAVGVGYFLFLK